MANRDQDHEERRRRRRASADNFRLPPQNLEAEQALIGAVLLQPAQLDEVAVIVSAEDFYREEHVTIWRHVMAAYGRGVTLDVVTLADDLAMASPEMDSAITHWTIRLGEFMGYVPSGVCAVEYASTVRGYGLKRRLIEAATEIIEDAYRNDKKIDELADNAEQRLFSVTDERVSLEVESLRKSTRTVMDRADTRTDDVGGVATGYSELDSLLDGLKPKQMMIVAARPSLGKTAFAVNLIRNAAITNRIPTLFVSLEMSKQEIAERFLSLISGVPSQRLRIGARMVDGEFEKMRAAYHEIQNTSIWVDDSPTRSALAITATARRFVSRHGVGLVVVDYLQLIEPDEARDTRQEQVAKISRRMKTMARVLNVPVVVLAQLNRKVEERDGKVPRLGDLRESGALEQDADSVLLLHRPEYYKHGDRPGEADLIVAKNRNGDTGTVKLLWSRTTGRFRSFGPDAADHGVSGPAY